ncbi:MAG: GNAT family N-acetyltransferase [Ilumatobacteraceae bacterium]|nr:GNAT family N-acetyltransferase [Ilumatobacteraceae bacterium]
MTLEVREMQPDDDRAAAGAIVQGAYFRLPGYPRDEEYDLLLGDVASRARDSCVVVAVLDGHLVGCLTYVVDMSGPHGEFDDDDAASFRYFGVHPSVQGSGVGEAMVQWCIDTARVGGRHRLRIHTLESMPGAQRLYLRMGFLRDPDNDEEWDGIKGLAFVYHC